MRSAVASTNCVAPVKGAPFNNAGGPPFVERYKLNATSDGSVPSTRQLTSTCVALVRTATTPRPRFSIRDGGSGDGSAIGITALPFASTLLLVRLTKDGCDKAQNIATANAHKTIQARFVSLNIFVNLIRPRRVWPLRIGNVSKWGMVSLLQTETQLMALIENNDIERYCVSYWRRRDIIIKIVGEAND